MNLRIRIGRDEAQRILNDMPGGPELWDKVTQAFIEAYENYGQPEVQEKETP
jgi:hypothetical protein